MGRPAPSAGRRSAASAANSPRCSSSGCRRTRRLRLAVPGSGREPLRRDFRSRHADPQDCLLQSGDPQMAGRTRPRPSRCLAPRQSGSCARLLPGRPRGIGTSAETVCRLACAPVAAESATWRTVPLVRCISRSLRYDRGVARGTRCSAPGPGFPDRRSIAPARPASRTTGFPRQMPHRCGNAELLRRAQVILDFRRSRRPRRS